ncbi:MAG: hypothetical protein CMJ77_22540 [Planctomycetaceae bacterium]|nr:hypothetical protein [Planctomycetaceae bacterium]
MKLLISTGPGLIASREGHVVVLDYDRKCVIDALSYEHRVHESNRKGLEGASWYKDNLLVASECELLTLEVAPLKLVTSRSFPFFNDVHHVVASGNQIWICNSGLDRIDEFDDSWRPVRSHCVMGPPARRLRYAATSFRRNAQKWYSRLRGWEKAYDHLQHRPIFKTTRKILFNDPYGQNGRDLRFSYFRPHVLHPNHLFLLKDDVLVTLFATGELISLKTKEILVNDLGKPHDGVVADDELYVTDCSTNRLLVYSFDATGPKVGSKILDTKITEKIEHGFLRGVAVSGDVVYVGLTARRNAPKDYSRAAILKLDRSTHEILDEWILPEEYGKNIFTILNAGDRYN